MSCYNFSCPITITEGGTFKQPFQWKSGDPLLPVDITGYTTLTQIRLKLTDAAPLLEIPHTATPWEADGDTGVYLTEPEDGIFLIYINDADTIGLCAAHKDLLGVYNCFLYSPEGEAVVRIYGPVTILAAAALVTP